MQVLMRRKCAFQAEAKHSTISSTLKAITILVLQGDYVL